MYEKKIWSEKKISEGRNWSISYLNCFYLISYLGYITNLCIWTSILTRLSYKQKYGKLNKLQINVVICCYVIQNTKLMYKKNTNIDGLY